jgi:hypothetical protein
MLDLGVIKSALDLFQQLLGIIDRSEKAKHDMFNEIFKPLYEQLELVIKEYYALIRQCSTRLSDANPDFMSILNEMETNRAALVLSRNAVVGESFAIANVYGSHAVPVAGKIQALAKRFAEDISNLFNRGNYMFYGDSHSGRRSTAVTGLMQHIRQLAEGGRHDQRDLQSRREIAKKTLEDMEKAWTNVTGSYMEWRLYCVGKI